MLILDILAKLFDFATDVFLAWLAIANYRAGNFIWCAVTVTLWKIPSKPSN